MDCTISCSAHPDTLIQVRHPHMSSRAPLCTFWKHQCDFCPYHYESPSCEYNVHLPSPFATFCLPCFFSLGAITQQSSSNFISHSSVSSYPSFLNVTWHLPWCTNLASCSQLHSLTSGTCMPYTALCLEAEHRCPEPLWMGSWQIHGSRIRSFSLAMS